MRSGLLTVSIALAGWFLTSFAHAQTSDKSAACLGLNGERQPAKVTFDDGSVVNVIDRSGDKISLESLTPSGTKSNLVSQYGLFTLTFDSPNLKLENIWNQDLARFIPLKVGDRISADAAAKNPAANSALSAAVFLDLSVMGVENIRVGECDYPVFKIDFRSQIGGGPQVATVTHYYHEASMLMLRTVTTIPATAVAPTKIVDRRAMKLE